jgi:hypothetical protein
MMSNRHSHRFNVQRSAPSRPSHSTPKPVPSGFQPIIFKSLFPTLLSSFPGFTSSLMAAGILTHLWAGVGPPPYAVACAYPQRLREVGVRGTSGWLCMTRRSEVQSRYFGARARAWPSPSPHHRRFASLKLRPLA